EQELAVFWSQSHTGIRNLDAGETPLLVRADRELATIRHCIQGVEHKIRERAVQQIGIGSNFRHLFSQLEFEVNPLTILRGLKKATDILCNFIQLHALELRLRHL